MGYKPKEHVLETDGEGLIITYFANPLHITVYDLGNSERSASTTTIEPYLEDKIFPEHINGIFSELEEAYLKGKLTFDSTVNTINKYLPKDR